MTNWIAAPLLAVVSLSACGGSQPLPRFESAPCRFKLPAGQTEGQTVSCGDLLVAQDRGRSDSPVLRLHVLRLHSTTAPDGTPTLFLMGGPGEFVGPMIKNESAEQVAALTANGDFLFLDYRGLEKSVPAFDCPAVGSSTTAEGQARALGDCYLENDSKGFDISDYRSQTTADDVEDLRKAMSYSQLNLYGVSYGTRFALEVMRRHPDGIRAAVLDSPVPPQMSSHWGAFGTDLQAAYRALAAACAADSSCDSKYPNLENQLTEAVDSLNQTPLSITIGNDTSSLDGNSAVRWLDVAMHYSQAYSKIPKAIDAANRRDADVLGQVLQQVTTIQAPMSVGMHFAVECNDFVQYSSSADLVGVQQAVSPEMAAAFADDIAFELSSCASMPHKWLDPVDLAPVASSIPTLIMVGEFDPVTPPANGAAAAATLSKATQILFPKSGHANSLTTACGSQLVTAFLAAPELALDTSCTAALNNLAFE